MVPWNPCDRFFLEPRATAANDHSRPLLSLSPSRVIAQETSWFFYNRTGPVSFHDQASRFSRNRKGTDATAACETFHQHLCISSARITHPSASLWKCSLHSARGPLVFRASREWRFCDGKYWELKSSHLFPLSPPPFSRFRLGNTPSTGRTRTRVYVTASAGTEKMHHNSCACNITSARVEYG